MAETMRNSRWTPGPLVGALVCLLLLEVALVEAAGRTPVRVMTFNIRFDYEDDGENRWHERARLVAGSIRRSRATVLLLQEDKSDQLDDLRELLPQFEFLGRGRNASGSGEVCSIGYDTRQWEVVESGDFWLSTTPDDAGSRSWGSYYPHKATWAVLRHRKTKGTALFLSTHFEDRKKLHTARSNSARAIRDFLDGREEKLPVVMGGDFNTDPDNKPHEILTSQKSQPRLVDVWIEVEGEKPYSGTVHHFEGGKNHRRIDWILASEDVSAKRILIDKTDYKGRFPSDHYPVVADLILP